MVRICERDRNWGATASWIYVYVYANGNAYAYAAGLCAATA